MCNNFFLSFAVNLFHYKFIQRDYDKKKYYSFNSIWYMSDFRCGMIMNRRFFSQTEKTDCKESD